MTIKSKRIHLIEREDRIKRVDNQVWECGYWSLPEPKAKSLLNGSVLFHKKRNDPSFFGGIILNYRIQDTGKWKGRVIFTFEYRADHRMALAQGGWSKDMKIVLKE